MPKRKTFSVKKREFFGRKVKELRKKGILPANIYGSKTKSLAVQVDQKGFLELFQKAGETELVDLEVEGEKEARPVLIHNVQLEPVYDYPIHVDFLQVDLKEKITTPVPLQFVGESPAVVQGEGVFLELLSEVEVECLPTEIPSHIEVDISNLAEIDAGIQVKDLKLPKEVEVRAEPELMVCKIETSKEEEEVAPAEEGPAEGVEEEGKQEGTEEEGKSED